MEKRKVITGGKKENGSLSGAPHAAVWSIFCTRVHALTQPPNQPTTFVDGGKIIKNISYNKRNQKELCFIA